MRFTQPGPLQTRSSDRNCKGEDDLTHRLEHSNCGQDCDKVVNILCKCDRGVHKHERGGGQAPATAKTSLKTLNR